MMARTYVVSGAALLLLIATFFVVTPLSVQAHALLLRSNPQAGAELSVSPATIELWFSEPLEDGFSGAHLVDTMGVAYAVGNSLVDSADPTHITLPLPSLAPGIYTVVWQTLSSADGHEWVGSFPLTILNADGSRPAITGTEVAQAQRTQPIPTAIAIFARWLSLMGGLILCGMATFGLWGEDILQQNAEGQRVSSVQANDLVLVAAIVALLFGGWEQMITQADRLGNRGLFVDLLLTTRMGNLILFRQGIVVFMLVGGLALRRWQSEMRPLLTLWFERRLVLLLSLMVLATFSLGSHAAAVGGSGWAMIADFIHLVAAAVWIGGLWRLAIIFRQQRHQLQTGEIATANKQLLWRAVQRFSMVATLAVYSLLVTGVFSMAVQLRTLPQLWTSAYGQVLLLKVLLIGIALALALANHRLVRAPERADDDLAHAHGRSARYRTFARQIGGESVVGLAIVVVVAVLVQTPPPPAIATPSPPSLWTTALTADDLQIHLQIAPNQVGDNRYIVHLYHVDGSAIGEVQLVRLQFEHQTATLGQARLELTARGQDIFQGSGAYLNRAGRWALTVYVRRRGLDDLQVTATVDVPEPGVVPTPMNAPWQNPVPQFSLAAVIGSLLLMLAVAPLLWRYAKRSTTSAVQLDSSGSVG